MTTKRTARVLPAAVRAGPGVACLCAVLVAGPAPAQAPGSPLPGARVKPRVFVLTDISDRPDDRQSLVRLLVYANEFDVEGLVATTSVHNRTGLHPDVLHRFVDAFAQVRDNLEAQAPGFPTGAQLVSLIKPGNPGYGLAAVGDGKSSEGARLLIAAVDRPDPRPLWVAVWGGANTLAQALYDVRKTRARKPIDDFVARLRVHAISDQDDAGPWLRSNFKNLYYVVSPDVPGGPQDHRATWTGIAGDRLHRNGPMLDFDLVDNPWLAANVIDNHGPLGALYPPVSPDIIMEGATPSFLNLIGNGLGAEDDPGAGGWGGRYGKRMTHGETRPIYTDTRDTVALGGSDGRKAVAHTSEQATIWRWRRAFQHDFAARMMWSTAAAGSRVNHNPIALVNGDASKARIDLAAVAGAKITLSAAGTGDPDGHKVGHRWFIYPEAGTLPRDVQEAIILAGARRAEVSFTAPAVKEPGTLHLILEVEDSGKPSLFSYRRVVVTVTP